jgi:hypothetical protein
MISETQHNLAKLLNKQANMGQHFVESNFYQAEMP